MTAELLDRPVHERSALQVREHDALRLAGRAGRVEDVREVRVRRADVGRDVGRRSSSAAPQEHRRPSRRRRPRRRRRRATTTMSRAARLRRELAHSRPSLLVTRQRRPAVRRDVAERGAGRPRVERHVGRARLQDAVDGDDAPRATCRGRGRRGRRVDARVPRAGARARFAGVELRVRDRALAVDDRVAIGSAPRRRGAGR